MLLNCGDYRQYGLNQLANGRSKVICYVKYLCGHSCLYCDCRSVYLLVSSDMFLVV